MRNNFDKILLGILWLLVIILATTFWMNITYGFNLFSGAHWAYLSELQAKKVTIQPDFYMSLIGGVLIAIIGLYLLLRPRAKQTPTQEPQEQVQPAPTYSNNAFNSRPMSPLGNRPHSIPSTPPQINLPTTPTVPRTAPTVQTAPNQTALANPLASEIRNILESAGYTIKPCTKIGNVLSPVVTLGYNQTLYIITSNVSVSAVQEAVNTLSALFLDTLGDTANDITTLGIVVHPTDANTEEFDAIKTFENTDAFKQFIQDNPNTQPADYDSELFEAMDTYINTVTGYIGKN